MKNLLIPFLFIFIAACSGGKKESIFEQRSAANEDHTPRKSLIYSRMDFTEDAEFLSQFETVRKKYTFVPYVTKTPTGTLFIFSTEPYKTPSQEINHTFYTLVGLSDGKGTKLLDCRFNKIGNPGVIASDYMEVEENGEYGLYNYRTKKLIRPYFEAIFPSAIMAYVAIGQRDNLFYKIYEDGIIIEIEDPNEIPAYCKLGKKINFNIQDKRICWWINTVVFSQKMDYDQYQRELNAMVVPPSYIARLNVMDPFIDYIARADTHEGIHELYVNTEKIVPRNKRLDNFIEYVYEKDKEEYLWETERKFLITIGKQNQVIDSRLIWQKEEDDFKCPSGQSLRFVSDSLVEVQETQYEYPGYHSTTGFSYFEITAKGKIVPLYADCHFEMASIIKLNESHFKGCLLVFKENLSHNNNAVVTSHLSLYDIEYMKNELYARHGLIFKDPEWRKIFSGQKWYKPTSNNVDSKLTPLEKKNLRFIQDYEQKMKGKETKYTRPIETFFSDFF